MKNFYYFSTLILMAALMMQSCVSSFSELQGARLVGEGNAEITPYYTTVSGGDQEDYGGVQNQIGLNMAVGLSSKMDLRMRVENIWLKDDDFSNGYAVVGVGPKLSLVENIMSAYLPVGRALGENTSDSWEIQPTLLLTLPAVENILDINLTPKYIFNLCEDCDDYLAFNLGLAVSNNLSKWAFRAEYGLLYDPGETGHYGQFSVGVSAILHK